MLVTIGAERVKSDFQAHGRGEVKVLCKFSVKGVLLGLQDPYPIPDQLHFATLI